MSFTCTYTYTNTYTHTYTHTYTLSVPANSGTSNTNFWSSQVGSREDSHTCVDTMRLYLERRGGVTEVR
jgi:hypothetical protein